jgi:hypothetical protein
MLLHITNSCCYYFTNLLLPTLVLHHALAHAYIVTTNHAFIVDPTCVPPTYTPHLHHALPHLATSCQLVTSCCNNQQRFVVVNLSCYCLLIDIMLATMKCFIPHFIFIFFKSYFLRFVCVGIFVFIFLCLQIV